MRRPRFVEMTAAPRAARSSYTAILPAGPIPESRSPSNCFTTLRDAPIGRLLSRSSIPCLRAPELTSGSKNSRALALSKSVITTLPSERFEKTLFLITETPRSAAVARRRYKKRWRLMVCRPFDRAIAEYENGHGNSTSYDYYPASKPRAPLTARRKTQSDDEPRPRYSAAVTLTALSVPVFAGQR